MKKSGIYIVQLRNTVPMPVTKDARYVNTCARVNWANMKVGKAKDLAVRESNYWKEFGEENVLFELLAEVDDIVNAERTILRALTKYRKVSPKGRRLEWLEGIVYGDLVRIAFAALDGQGIEYKGKVSCARRS